MVHSDLLVRYIIKLSQFLDLEKKSHDLKIRLSVIHDFVYFDFLFKLP